MSCSTWIFDDDNDFRLVFYRVSNRPDCDMIFMLYRKSTVALCRIYKLLVIRFDIKIFIIYYPNLIIV